MEINSYAEQLFVELFEIIFVVVVGGALSLFRRCALLFNVKCRYAFDAFDAYIVFAEYTHCVRCHSKRNRKNKIFNFHSIRRCIRMEFIRRFGRGRVLDMDMKCCGFLIIIHSTIRRQYTSMPHACLCERMCVTYCAAHSLRMHFICIRNDRPVRHDHVGYVVRLSIFVYVRRPSTTTYTPCTRALHLI